MENKLIVGLDIGTTKICVVAAELDNDGNIGILGIGTSPSEGLNKGVVANIGAAVKSIKKAVIACELKSGIKIENVYAGIAGHHIQGINSEGVVAVKGTTITESDIQRVIESARAFNAPDKDIIHTLSQEYIVDGQDGIKDPIGMAGKRLQAKVHIVLGAVTSATNIIECCKEAGLNVISIVLEPLASSLAVLEREEKELGVILLDIGGGTTDMVIYRNEAIVYTSVLPIGGNQVTNDISVGLRAPRTEALRIKHEFGTALKKSVRDDEIITVSGISGRQERIISKHLLTEVLEARFREIFELIAQEIDVSGYGPTSATGVVLTGGSSLLSRLDTLASEVLNMPVRIGSPINVGGLNELVSSPMYATAVGLVRYGAQNSSDIIYSKTANPENTYASVLSNFKGLLKNFF
ncbi:MAG: cell division protein FtsA [bacterium]